MRRLDVGEGDLDQRALLAAALDRKLRLVGFDQRLGQWQAQASPPLRRASIARATGVTRGRIAFIITGELLGPRQTRHCEERSDEASQRPKGPLRPWIASLVLAMTVLANADCYCAA